MIEQNIAAMLAEALASLNIPTQWENSPFEPESSVTYLRESLLFADTVAIGLSKTDLYSGIYQVTVMSPKGAGKGEGRSIADQVKALFQRGDRLTRDSVILTVMQASVNPSAIIGDRWATPVSINWRVTA